MGTNRTELHIREQVSSEIPGGESPLLGIIGEINNINPMRVDQKFGVSIHLKASGMYRILISQENDTLIDSEMSKEQIELLGMVINRFQELNGWIL